MRPFTEAAASVSISKPGRLHFPTMQRSDAGPGPLASAFHPFQPRPQPTHNGRLANNPKRTFADRRRSPSRATHAGPHVGDASIFACAIEQAVVFACAELGAKAGFPNLNWRADGFVQL